VAHTGHERTEAARAAFRDQFAQEVRERFPDLSEAEVYRRADLLRKAHYTRLALASVKARRQKQNRQQQTKGKSR